MSDMSDTCFEILQLSCTSGNYIPSGQQLPMTLLLINVTRQLDFTTSEEPEQNMEDGVRDEGNQKRQTNTEELPESHDPHSMLKGMKVYQLTATDLEFLKTKEEQLVKKLKVKLEEVQKLLKTKMVALALACASKEKAEAELKRLRIQGLMRQLSDLKAKLAQRELRIQGLMRQLSDLKAELAQQEEACKSLEMQVNITAAPEIKEDLYATKSQMKMPRKRQKKAVKFTKTLQDATNTSKSTRSRNRDTLKTSTEEPTRSGAPGGQQKKKVKANRGVNEEAEEQDLNSQESVQPVRGRRMPAGIAQTSFPKEKSK